MKVYRAETGQLVHWQTNTKIIKNVQDLKKEIERDVQVPIEDQILMTDYGKLVKNDNFSEIMQSIGKDEYIVFCYDRRYLGAVENDIEILLDSETPPLEPDLPAFNGPLIYKEFKSTPLNVKSIIKLFLRFESYNQIILKTTNQHDELSQLIVREQKMQSMALQVAMMNLESHIKLAENSIKQFISNASKEYQLQQSFINTFQQDISILRNIKIDRNNDKKAVLLDFIDQQQLLTTRNDTADLCKYLANHIKLLKEEMNELKLDEIKFHEQIHSNSNLESLDTILIQIQHIKQEIKSIRSRTERDFKRMCDKISALLNKPISVILDTLDTLDAAPPKKQLDSFMHLIQFHLNDYLPKLFKFELEIRKKTFELILSKRNSIKNFIINMAIISEFQQHLSQIQPNIDQHLTYLDDFKERYKEDDLRILKDLLFSYGIILLELFRRKQEDQKRDTFKSIRFPFKLHFTLDSIQLNQQDVYNFIEFIQQFYQNEQNNHYLDILLRMIQDINPTTPLVRDTPKIQEPLLLRNSPENEDLLKEKDQEILHLKEIIKNLESEKDEFEAHRKSFLNELKNKDKSADFRVQTVEEDFHAKLNDLQYELEEERHMKKNLEIEYETITNELQQEIITLKEKEKEKDIVIDQLHEDLDSIKEKLESERLKYEQDLIEKQRVTDEIKALQQQTRNMVKRAQDDWLAKDEELKKFKEAIIDLLGEFYDPTLSLDQSMQNFKLNYEQTITSLTQDLSGLSDQYTALNDLQHESKIITNRMAEKLEEYRKNLVFEIINQLRLPMDEDELSIMQRKITPSDDDTAIWNQILQLASAINTQKFVLKLHKCVKDNYEQASQYRKEYKSIKEKYNKLCTVYCDKIAFRNFKVGDVALFLPSRNSTGKPLAAFNINAPHYFLKNTDAQNKEYTVARITSISEHITDENEADSNPFGLPNNTKYHLLEVEHWRTNKHHKKRQAPVDTGLASITTLPNQSPRHSNHSSFVHTYTTNTNK